VSRHRATEVRPRYPRLVAAAGALAVTAIAVLGGTGVLPVSSTGAPALASNDVNARLVTPAAALTADNAPAPSADSGTEASADAAENAVDPKLDVTLPADSGAGTRVVFSQGRQRVWLVTGKKHVQRTYLVSGSVYDNLHPGTFQVYSRSEDAWGVDDSGSMKYFVRFTQGDSGAAIGFHDIPVKNGQLVQTEGQLGTPQSHGCIRQKRADAIALWKFAPLGTTVVVTA
jgi:hypothetical protein